MEEWMNERVSALSIFSVLLYDFTSDLKQHTECGLFIYYNLLTLQCF